MKPKCRNLLFAATALLAVSSAHAQTGVWTNTATSSTWSTTGNWLNGTVADGSGNTADFTTGFTANTIVTLDSNRSIGHIIKDDTDGALNFFTIAASGTPASILTLATGGGAPTITNSDLGVGGRMDITAQLSGTQGLTKLGVGNVMLNKPTPGRGPPRSAQASCTCKEPTSPTSVADPGATSAWLRVPHSAAIISATRVSTVSLKPPPSFPC